MRFVCVCGRSMMALVALVLVPPGAGDVRAQTEAVELATPHVVLRGVALTITVEAPTGVLPE